VDAVAHHHAHGAGVIIRPNRLRAEFALGCVETIGDFVQRFVPRDPREVSRAFRTGTAQRKQQPIRVMNALGIAGDFGADHAGGIALELRTTHAPDGGAIDHFDVERASRWAVVRTGRMPDVNFGLLIHARFLASKTGSSEGIYALWLCAK